MITKQQLISDVILQLTQASPSDDLELEESQVAYWISYELNSLIATEINSKIQRGEMIPSIYIKRAACEVAEVEDTECADDCDDRIFIELDEEILTLNKDWGVIQVQTDQGDIIRKASVESLNMFRFLRFAKPSEQNLMYSHQGKKIFIEGLKAVDIPFDNINVWYVPKQDLSTLEDTAEVLVSDLVLPQLIDLVVERGKLQMYGTTPDTDNDGQDVKNIQYHRAIQNPANEQQPQ